MSNKIFKTYKNQNSQTLKEKLTIGQSYLEP